MTERNPFHGVKIKHLPKEELQKYPNLLQLNQFTYPSQTIDGMSPSDVVVRLMVKALTVAYNSQDQMNDLFTPKTFKTFIPEHKKFHACIDVLRNNLNQGKFFDYDEKDYFNQPVELPENVSFMGIEQPITPSEFAKEITNLGKTFYREKENQENTLITELGLYLENRFDKRKATIKASIMVHNTEGVIGYKDHKSNQKNRIENTTEIKTKQHNTNNNSGYVTPRLEY